MNIQEFKPTIIFLLKFAGIYFICSLIYGWYVTSYHPVIDPFTSWVTGQTSYLLNLMGWNTLVADQSNKATSQIIYLGKPILAVFEGCNGLNVMIIFIAFLFSFGPYTGKLVWFAPLGMLLIHVFNLARIYLLFFVSIEKPDYMYFTHKYLFTAVLYVVIFLLWVYWIKITLPKIIES